MLCPNIIDSRCLVLEHAPGVQTGHVFFIVCAHIIGIIVIEKMHAFNDNKFAS